MYDLRIARVYAPVDERDGMRILVDRLWPRGMTRERAQLDDWWKDIAPTPGLRRDFGHNPTRFTTFRARYEAELEGNALASAMAQRCGEMLESGDVTLLYAARDETLNHAVVLRDWLATKLNA